MYLKLKKGSAKRETSDVENGDEEAPDEETSGAAAGNKIPVFGFPNAIPGLRRKWINFVKHKDWVPTVYSGICREHFDRKYITEEKKRSTLVLHLDPVPVLT